MATLGLRWLELALDTTAKSLLLALTAAAVIWMFKIRNSPVRHRIWSGVLAGMLALPCLSQVVPRLRLPLPIPQHWLASIEEATPEGLQAAASRAFASQTGDASDLPTTQEVEFPSKNSPLPSTDTSLVPPNARSERLGELAFANPALKFETNTASRITAESHSSGIGNNSEPLSVSQPAAEGIGPQLLRRSPQWLAGLWLLGATIMLTRLLFGLATAWRLRRVSVPITSVDLQELGISASCWPTETRPGLLLECPLISVPLTLGLFRPVVLLPPEWLLWSAEKLEAVLLHERTHVERGDSAIAVLAELNCSLNWFNPLSWWLSRHLSTLAEEICDDAAIRGIGNRTVYAKHLLEVAAAVSSTRGRILPVAVSMARRSNVESRIDAILDFTRPLSKRPTWTTTLLILVLSGPVIALAAALTPGSAPHRSDEVEPDASPKTEAAAAVAPPSNAAKVADDQAGLNSVLEHFRYVGTVLDAHGQPIEDAKITLNYHRRQNDEPIPAKFATTNAKGQFELTYQLTDFQDSPEDKPWTFAHIVATKPGHGFASASSVPFEASGQILNSLPVQVREYLNKEGAAKDRTLRLPVDLPIQGRIVDADGRPVPGALIEPFNADEGQNGSLDAWEAATKTPGANFYSARSELRRLFGGDFVNGPIDRTMASVKTDANGVFTLAGVGRERIVSAVLSGPNIESSILRLRSRKGDVIKLSDDDRGNNARKFTYYPAEFTHVAGPSQAVEGVVTDLKTGKPIAGVFVRGERTATYNVGGNAGFIRSTTDQEGRYRLSGFPLGTNQFVFLPTAKSGYLPAGVEVQTTAGIKPHVEHVSLTPAIRARGIVKEASSGKPIRGYATYFILAGNPALQETRNFQHIDLRSVYPTDAEGRFEIPVLPGTGVITFSVHDHESYVRGEGADKIMAPLAQSGSDVRVYRAQPYYLVSNNFHGLIPIEPSIDSNTIDVSLKLTALQSFRGRVVASDGKVIEQYVMYGERAPASWYDHTNASFKINGYQSAYGRRLMAYDRKTDAVGLLDVKDAAPSDVEIRLQPASRISGRLVDDDGQPMPAARIENDIRFVVAPSPISASDHWNGKFDPERAEFVAVPGHPILTDANGRFELLGVAPGLKYSARVLGTRKFENNSYDIVLGSIFTDVVAMPGEKHDLGDVKISDQQPKTGPAPESPAALDKSSTKPSAAPEVQTQPAAGKKMQDKQLRDSATTSIAGEGKTSTPAAVTSRTEKESIMITGIARRPDGQPIEGAKVAMAARPKDLMHEGLFLVVAETQTDRQGRFHLAPPNVSRASHTDICVVGGAPGSGTTWETLDSVSQGQELVLTLNPELEIRGRVMDTEARPAAGIPLRIDNLIDRSKSEPYDGPAGSAMAKSAAWPSATVTDADGRFILRGVSANVGVLLEVDSSERFAPQTLAINTGVSETRAENDGTYRSQVKNPGPGKTAEFVLSPAQIFEGVVRYADSKQPAAHARISIWASQQMYGSMITVDGQADATGRYRLHARPGIRFGITAYPAAGEPYFASSTSNIAWQSGATPMVVDINLPRGVLIRGTVVNQETGAPEPNAAIQYIARQETLTKLKESIITGWQGIKRSATDGSFSICVPPGPGTLLIHGGDGKFILQETTRKQLNLGQPGGVRWYAHAIVPIDPNSESPITPLRIGLRPAKSVTGSMVNEAGQPIPRAKIISRLCITPDSPSWREFTWDANHGQFEMRGLAPEKSETVHFLDADQRLGATVTLNPNEKGRAVTLKPCGQATAKFVTAAGDPVAEFEPTLHFVMTPGSVSMNSKSYRAGLVSADEVFVNNLDRANHGTFLKTDTAGTVTFPALIPGARYRVVVIEGNEGAVSKSEFVAESGQTIDLGRIVVERPNDG